MSLDGQSRSNFAAAGAPSPSNAKLRSMERTYCESVDILWIHVKIPARTRISSLSLSTPTKDQVDFVTYLCLHDSKGTLLLSQIKRARNFHGFTKKGGENLNFERGDSRTCFPSISSPEAISAPGQRCGRQEMTSGIMD